MSQGHNCEYANYYIQTSLNDFYKSNQNFYVFVDWSDVQYSDRNSRSCFGFDLNPRKLKVDFFYIVLRLFYYRHQTFSRNTYFLIIKRMKIIDKFSSRQIMIFIKKRTTKVVNQYIRTPYDKTVYDKTYTYIILLETAS